jgi:hypothetical protein
MAIGIVPRAAWRRGESYDYLRAVERAMFAWEWLRRTEGYNRAWARAHRAGPDQRAALARRFGLAELVAPTLDASEARPIWRRECDPRVIVAVPGCGHASAGDRLDIRALAGQAAIAISAEDVEHWRIGTPARSVRLDLCDGTLLGGPTALSYRLTGFAALRPQLAPLADLVHLVLASNWHPVPRRETRAARWIAELRTADALASGATQQEIARALFGAAVGAWRAGSDSYRYRVQRLVRAVRRRVADPLAALWFSG